MTHLMLRLLGWSGVFWALSAQAAPLPLESVPAPLRTWVPWALHAAPELRCPILDKGGRQCEWLGRLTLNIDADGASFAARVHFDRPGFVPLPGDSATPIVSVSEGKNTPLAPVWDSGTWQVFVGTGERTLTGRITWQVMPDALPIPEAFATLAVSGLASDAYRIEGGRLVLRAQLPGASNTESLPLQDGLHIEVQRRLVASRPTLLETRILLEVSGRPRLVEVPGALLEGFTLHALESSLGAELSAERTLVLEAQPGEWEISVVGRAPQPVLTLVAESAESLPEIITGETWVVTSKHLPIEAVEGGSPLDPAQTRLPTAWRSERAFRLAPAALLTVTLGEPQEARGSVTLHRELWLDFTGQELTGLERLTGTLLSESGRSIERLRLNSQAPWVPGRVVLEGLPRLITTDPTTELPGIEVPSGAFELVSEMRAPLEQTFQAQPVLPWATEATEVTGLLHLPPGFLLVGSGGVEASDSWLGSWDLWLAFVWFLSVFLAYRLFGLRVAVLALGALGLTLSTPSAPRALWVWLLAALATLAAFSGLLQNRPALGRGLRQAFRAVALGAALMLVGHLLAFALSDVKLALFPALEAGYTMEIGSNEVDGRFSREKVKARRRSGGSPTDLLAAIAEESHLSTGGVAYGGRIGSASKRSEVRETPRGYGAGNVGSLTEASASTRIDPSKLAPAQTGTGLPLWRWRTHTLSWPSPATESATFRLWLLPPWLVAVLRVLRTAMILAFAGFCLRRLAHAYREDTATRPAASAPPLAVTLALLLGLALLLPGAAVGQTELAAFPNEVMLTELRERLAEPPACAPHCAALAHLQVRADGNQLVVELDMEHVAAVVSALPTLSAGAWPERIVVSGKTSARATRIRGTLLFDAPAGRHNVRLEGALGEDVATLHLPYTPRKLTLALDHVLVEGVRDGRVTGDTLTLRKVAARPGPDEGQGRPQERASKSLKRQSVEPFGHLTRTLEFTSQWQLSTTLTRENASQDALHVVVPRLPGETPLDDRVEVVGETLKVTLPASSSALSWASRVEPRETLRLESTASPQVATFWQLRNAGPWHVRASQPGQLQGGEGDMLAWTPPAPGEHLEVSVLPLAASAGTTTTLTQVKLSELQGTTSRRSTLMLRLRSSTGEAFSVPLPDGAVLTHVKRDTAPIATNRGADGLRITVPPGEHDVEIEWTAPQAPGFWLRTSPLTLPFPTRNVSLALDVGEPRWLLWLQGPGAGPALLFWPAILLLGVLAVVLGRLPLHLTALSWFLLGLGLTQSLLAAGLTLVALFGVCLWRRRVDIANPYLFNLRQLLLLWLMLAALVTLIDALRTGLLGVPRSYVAHVVGGAGGSVLEWFSAAQVTALPQATVISAPMWFYKLLMFAWALWLATALPNWVRWIGASVVQDGLIKPLKRPKPATKPDGGAPPPPSPSATPTSPGASPA